VLGSAGLLDFPGVIVEIVDEFIEVAGRESGEVEVADTAITGLVLGGDEVNLIGMVFPEKTKRFKAGVAKMDQDLDGLVNVGAGV